jgi:type II secretory pathway pseudopilin PulG
MATITIALVLMAAAVPSWRYVMKDDREEELIFRGIQIAEAIQRYQKKNGNALPTSLEVLVKGKYLPRLYKDPMTKSGKWRLVHQPTTTPAGVPGVPGVPGPSGQGPGGLGQGQNPFGGGGFGSPSPLPSGSPDPGDPAQQGFGLPQEPGGGLGAAGTSVGPIYGVASTSKDKSLRVVNGRKRYDEWLFMSNADPIVTIGRPTTAVPGAGIPGLGKQGGPSSGPFPGGGFPGGPGSGEGPSSAPGPIVPTGAPNEEPK